MTHTHVCRAEKLQRNIPGFLQGLRELRRRNQIIRDSFLRIVSGFSRRPQPASPWNRAADGTQMPGGRMIEAIRAAILSANAESPELGQFTLEQACAFCDELKADFTSLLPKAEELSLVQLAIQETETKGAAWQAEINLVAHPTPIEAERAVLPLECEERKLARLLEGCRYAARQTTPLVQVAR